MTFFHHGRNDGYRCDTYYSYMQVELGNVGGVILIIRWLGGGGIGWYVWRMDEHGILAY